MNIFQATENHLDGLTALFDQYRVWYGAKTDMLKGKIFLADRISKKESVIYIIADDKNQYMGFVQLYPIFSSVRMKPVWLLNDLFINEQHRDKGLGTLLLNCAKDHCKKSGYLGIMLETEKHNHRGNFLYKREGFELEDHNLYFWTLDV